MKKVISLFLVLIYTISVSGMVVQKRFCGEKLIASGLAGTLKDCCSSEKMKDCGGDCCLQKSEVVKVDAAQEKPVSPKILKIVLPAFTSTLFSGSSFRIPAEKNKFSSVGILPQKIPLRILILNFRI